MPREIELSNKLNPVLTSKEAKEITKGPWTAAQSVQMITLFKTEITKENPKINPHEAEKLAFEEEARRLNNIVDKNLFRVSDIPNASRLRGAASILEALAKRPL